MADKKSFALRIDAGTMRAIEKWADDEFRSVNGQIEWILHRALKESGRVRHPPEGEGGTKETDPLDKAGPPG